MKRSLLEPLAKNDLNFFDLRPRAWAVLLLACVVVFSACKKPTEDRGTDLLPDGQELGVVIVDSIPLLAYTVLEDSVRTSLLSRSLLGSYLDRDFGHVKASIVTQILLSTSNVGAGQDPADLALDSIVLSLEFDELGYGYGDLDPQVFKVFELDTLLDADSLFYNVNMPPVIDQDLVQFKGDLIKPRPLNSAYVGPDTLLPQLRIRLDDVLGQRFLDLWGQSELASNTAFLDHFKGLSIEVDNDDVTPYEGGVLYFDLLDADSKVTLYYRDNGDPVNPDTLEYDFVINSNAVRYTVTEFDHTLALDPSLSIALSDSTLNTNCYVQAGGGLRTIIIPDLTDVVDMDLSALNRVEIVIPHDEAYYPFYRPADQLFVFRKDSEGKDALIPDQTGIFASDLGLWDEDANEYRFNLTQYFQGLLNGTYENTGLHLVSNNSGVSVNRTVLQGPAHPLEPMKIELIFSTY